MGIIFGRIAVEVPKYESLKKHTTPLAVEIRSYPSCVAARVSSTSFQCATSADFSNQAFGTLASYIGVFGNAQNIAKHEIAMTAPVVSEKIAMTAPVISEQIAMTSPILSTTGGTPELRSPGSTTPTDQPTGAVPADATAPSTFAAVSPSTSEPKKVETMAFLLPASYSMETAPKPMDPRVELVRMPERVEAVYVFNGTSEDAKTQALAAKVLETVRNDSGLEVAGEWYLARYNPPFTIPFFRTNEIHVPVRLTEGGG